MKKEDNKRKKAKCLNLGGNEKEKLKKGQQKKKRKA